MIACCARCARCSPAEELAMLPHAELAARLAEAYRLIAGLTAQAQQLTVQARELSARGAGTDVCGIPGRAYPRHVRFQGQARITWPPRRSGPYGVQGSVVRLRYSQPAECSAASWPASCDGNGSQAPPGIISAQAEQLAGHRCEAAPGVPQRGLLPAVHCDRVDHAAGCRDGDRGRLPARSGEPQREAEQRRRA